MLRCLRVSLWLGLVCLSASAQTAISVDLHKPLAPFLPVYSWFGYDESGYSFTPLGTKLLAQLHDLSPAPVYVRAHFLLASGDGVPDLKWSSTNVYSEDAAGNPIYSWTILDKIFDAYAAAHVRPMVELGFMPQALSTHPLPYHIGYPLKPGEVEGWSFPPRNLQRWQELNRQVAAHLAGRYGLATVSTWYWEVWNEPNLNYYWKGTQAEYDSLYDSAVAGVRASVPGALVGGPATTGPGPGGNSSQYLRDFLAHCAAGNVPLDFISFHVKGSPTVVGGHVTMGLEHELQNAAAGFAIIQSFPRFARLPVILSEADPEGCAACSAKQYPQNAYRNGPLYATYTAAAMKGLLDLAAQSHINLIGMLTWAFEFEGKPYFEGYRTLATNGVDKPVLNFFRMAGLMGGDRVEATGGGTADVDALATKTPREASVMVWNYHAEDVPAPATGVHVKITSIPAEKVLVQEFRIDEDHSNAWTVWKEMGSPQTPTAVQSAALEAAGQLDTMGSPRWRTVVQGTLAVDLQLPRNSIDLIRVTW